MVDAGKTNCQQNSRLAEGALRPNASGSGAAPSVRQLTNAPAVIRHDRNCHCQNGLGTVSPPGPGLDADSLRCTAFIALIARATNRARVQCDATNGSVSVAGLVGR